MANGYGPYYTSQLMAIRAQKKAVTGREPFAPWEMESIVRGELGGRYAAERSRRAEEREYGFQQSRLAMEGQRMRREERAAEMAGMGQAIMWSAPGGPLDISRGVTFGATQTGEREAQPGAAQRGVTGAMTTQQGINYLGSGLVMAGMVTGQPQLSLAGLGMKMASPIVTPIINRIGREISSLFAPGAEALSMMETGEMTMDVAGNLAMNIETGEIGLSSGALGYEAGTFSSAEGVGAGGGTVICTELHRQGLLNDITYMGDSAYGALLPEDVLAGYRVWAIHIAKTMSHSPTLTKIVSLFAIPWAKEMAHRMGIGEKGNMFGSIINKIGVPICGFMGRIILCRQEVAYG